MTLLQGVWVALSIAALGGVLWLCKIAIDIAEEERRKEHR